jgi:3-oxoadipate enol-lactonase
LTSLTLCCTTAHFPDPTPWIERIAAVAEGGSAPIAEAVVSRWFTPEWAAAHPEQVAECEAMVADTPDAGYLASCQAVQAWDHRDQLGSVAVPTLIIGGAGDTSTPIEPHSRTLVEGIPGARLEVVQGAHLATIEQPEETSKLIGAHAAT